MGEEVYKLPSIFIYYTLIIKQYIYLGINFIGNQKNSVTKEIFFKIQGK